MVSRIADMSVAEKTTVVSAIDCHCWGKADSPDGTNPMHVELTMKVVAVVTPMLAE